jgi:hypothetical protein
LSEQIIKLWRWFEECLLQVKTRAGGNVVDNNQLSIDPWYREQLEQLLDSDTLVDQDLYSIPLSIDPWYRGQLEQLRDNDGIRQLGGSTVSLLPFKSEHQETA